MAKVSIVKWSQIWIYVDGNIFFGLIYDFKIKLKTPISQKCGYTRSDTFDHGNSNPRPLYNSYFCYITIIKWSQICQNFIRKCFLEIFFQNINFPFYSPL